MTFILENSSLKYILSKFLGEGITCKCYLGEKLSPENSNELLAIKIFDPNNYKYYENEVNYLSKLSNNDNIIKLYDYGEGFITPLLNYNKNEKSEIKIDESQKQRIYFQILEYAPNGELKDYVIGTSTRIPEKISAKLFEQIVQTVKYLHMNNIAHCDIKPENVLMNINYRPLLNDFGFSQIFDGANGDYIVHHFSGTPIYCAPETRKAYVKGFDAIKNDIYSLGVLLFVITIGEFPYEIASFSDDKYRYIIKKNYNRFWEYFNDIEISDEFKDLINGLICITPSQRFNIEQILEHPWLKKYIKEENDTMDKNDKDIQSGNKLGKDFIDDDVLNEFISRKV
jgi:serine/threonine protein kinase